MARVFNEFLWPLVMPNLQEFYFSVDEEPDIVPILTGLTAIVNSFSRPSLVSEMFYAGESRLTEVTGALPFVTSLVVSRGVLTPGIRTMAEKDHLPKLTSFAVRVAYADMDIFIDTLETHWIRGTGARQSCCSTAAIIQSTTIYVMNAPIPDSVSIFLSRICRVRDRLKLEVAMIDLVACL